ncbi:hypothetical protein [Blastococcus sp. KM273128]|nr:hypothetical protein [Blastococcus sp. KM273128]
MVGLVLAAAATVRSKQVGADTGSLGTFDHALITGASTFRPGCT